MHVEAWRLHMQAVVDAGDTAAKNGGFFGPIATLFESVLKVSYPSVALQSLA